MRDFKQKRRYEIGYIQKESLPFSALPQYIFWEMPRGMCIRSIAKLMKKTAIAQAQLDKLNTREEQLSDSLVSLKTDIGVEKELREKFGVVKEGEQMILIVNKQEGNSEESSNEHQNIWQMFLNLF